MVYTRGMELYHVINRGIDGRKLFLDSGDYTRFIHDLYEFNDTAPAQAYERRSPRSSAPNVGPRRSYIRTVGRDSWMGAYGRSLPLTHFRTC